jgi:hypothetical protein
VRLGVGAEGAGAEMDFVARRGAAVAVGCGGAHDG